MLPIKSVCSDYIIFNDGFRIETTAENINRYVMPYAQDNLETGLVASLVVMCIMAGCIDIFKELVSLGFKILEEHYNWCIGEVDDEYLMYLKSLIC